MSSLIYIADCAIWSMIGLTKTVYNIFHYSVYGERQYEQKIKILTKEDLDLIKKIVEDVNKETLDVQAISERITIDTDAII